MEYIQHKTFGDVVYRRDVMDLHTFWKHGTPHEKSEVWFICEKCTPKQLEKLLKIITGIDVLSLGVKLGGIITTITVQKYIIDYAINEVKFHNGLRSNGHHFFEVKRVFRQLFIDVRDPEWKV